MSNLRKASALPKAAAVMPGAIHAAYVSARRLIEEAETTAAAILHEAREQASQIRAESREAGSEEGLLQWNQLVLQAQREAERLRDRNEAAMVRLALGIAGKIAGRVIAEDPEITVANVRRALQQLPWNRQMKLRVSPDDFAFVRDRVQAWAAEGAAPADIAVASDSSVGAGGCVVESSLGVVDARLDAQLRVLERALLEKAEA
jgi:flagellar biosynthesis/type III secretory pathway protein FliH